MPDEGKPPQGLTLRGEPEWERALQALRQVVEPLAEADKHRSDNETERYRLYYQAWSQEAGRGHGRFLVLTGMVFLVFIFLLGFAFYAYATGSPALATHVITGIFSALAGFLAGLGFRRGRQQ